MRLTKTVADLLVLRILDDLTKEGLIPPKPKKFNWNTFHRLKQEAQKTFQIPETSITPIMARLLFSISAIQKPSSILVIGAYVGHSLLWLVGPYLKSNYKHFKYAYGVDINPDVIKLAVTNFSRLTSNSRVRLICGDGHIITEKLKKTFDLVFLDADDSLLRKRVYLSILKSIYPMIKNGGLVLAHDICIPRFKEDLRPFLKEVHNSKLFIKTRSLEIDYCGLEISKKI